MSRYICKKCGRFVSKNATICKCCGCEDPAIEKVMKEPKIDGQIDGEMHKLIECPNCGFVFNPKNAITSEKVQCPTCKEDNINPYYSKSSGYTTQRKILGVIVLLIIGFNVYRACSTVEDSGAVDFNQHYNQSIESELSSIQSNVDIPKMDAHKDKPNSIVFKVIGTDEPSLMWVIKSKNGKFYYEHIAEDIDGKSILKSGSCVVMTFGQLKSQAPNTVIRNCPISTEKKIMLIGPIDTHYNSDYSERPIYGILVASKNNTAQLFINDTDEENVFVLLDNMDMKVE